VTANRDTGPSDDASDGFLKWLKRTSPSLEWENAHQLELLKKLERITSGESKRLLIFMPPRHGKSEMVTIRYAAWRIICDPKLNIILGCYNQKLADRFSRRIRQAVNDSGSVKLASDRRGSSEWETKEGGGVRAVGVGSGVTGYGAGLVIIDDPVKNRAEAESAVRRDNAWHWYSDDIYTRLEPDAPVIVIQTRWHEDDLSGRLLKNVDYGDQWEVIKLAAIAEADDPLRRLAGDALWPSRFSKERLEQVKRQMGSYSFAALYQQEPVPHDGGMFKRDHFKRIVERAPNGLTWARGYDLAVSTRTTADYTASFRCAFDTDGTLYIADGFRRRIEYPEQRRYVIGRLRQERNTAHGVEKALHGQALVQDLLRDVKVRGKPLQAVKVDSDKWTRALSWSNAAEEGKVVLVQGSWIDEFVTEACSFPHGEHDDQIDAVSLAVGMLSSRNKNKKTLNTFR